MAQAEEEPFVNFDEGNEAEAPSASKRNKTSASEGDLNVWSINKVIMYRPDRSKMKVQQFAAENSDAVKILGLNCVENLGGYRSGRAAFGINEGACYFETTVPDTGAVRVGWSTERGDPGAGVGYDIWQYGIRSLDGSAFHESRGHAYGKPFAPGDVIGAYIFLSTRPTDGSEERPPPIDPSKPLVEILEEKETCWMVRVVPGTNYTLPSSDILPVPRPGSYIAFFKNGVCLGTAFEEIIGGTYYPSVSPYRCKVTVNFGPDFAYPPQLPKGFAAPTPASNLVDKE